MNTLREPHRSPLIASALGLALIDFRRVAPRGGPRHPVVYSDGNGLTMTARDKTGFDRNHIRLGTKAKSTLVTSSRFLGGLQLDNAGKGIVVTGNNLDE